MPTAQGIAYSHVAIVTPSSVALYGCFVGRATVPRLGTVVVLVDLEAPVSARLPAKVEPVAFSLTGQ